MNPIAFRPLHSAPYHQAKPKFGSLWTNALSQFQTQLTGVVLPKAALSFNRNKIYGLEDLSLELIEAGAFFFALPLVSQKVLGPRMRQWMKVESRFGKDAVGKALKLTPGGASSPRLIAAKFGTILGALAVAGGLEYSVQFITNIITAKLFKTTDFNKIAGLEQHHAKQAVPQTDSVIRKAYRRFQQIALISAGLLAVAMTVPFAIARSEGLTRLVRPLVKLLDFSSGKGSYDLTKTTSALLIGIGITSYVDATRNPLEKKEVLTRLSMVVPYLLFGNELLRNALAWLLQKRPLAHQSIQQYGVSFLDRSTLFEDSYLNLNCVKSLDTLKQELSQSGLKGPLQKSVLSTYQWINRGSRVLCALLMGLGFTAFTFYMTQKRYNDAHAKLKVLPPKATQQPVFKNPFPAYPTFIQQPLSPYVSTTWNPYSGFSPVYKR